LELEEYVMKAVAMVEELFQHYTQPATLQHAY
jgi:hypothetical protein